MIQVTKAKYTTGSKLEVTFSDGTSGAVDLGAELGADRSPAEVKALLATVTLEGGAPFFAGEPDAHFAPSWYYARAHGLEVPKTLSEARANEAVISLRELRKRAGLNQRDAAKRAGITQPEVVRIEKQGDMRLSTLASYLSALGGRLKVVVDDPEGSVELGPFSIEQSAPRRGRAKKPVAGTMKTAQRGPRNKGATPKSRA